MSVLKGTLEAVVHTLQAITDQSDNSKTQDVCKIGKVLNITLKGICNEYCVTPTEDNAESKYIHPDKVLLQAASNSFLANLEAHLLEVLQGGEDNFCKGIILAIDTLDSLESSDICMTQK